MKGTDFEICGFGFVSDVVTDYRIKDSKMWLIELALCLGMVQHFVLSLNTSRIFLTTNLFGNNSVVCLLPISTWLILLENFRYLEHVAPFKHTRMSTCLQKLTFQPHTSQCLLHTSFINPYFGVSTLFIPTEGESPAMSKVICEIWLNYFGTAVVVISKFMFSPNLFF